VVQKKHRLVATQAQIKLAGKASERRDLVIEIYQTLARYNAWMNHKLYELAWDLDDSERRRDLNGFFKSIHGTLNHILVADLIWLRRLATHSKDFQSLSEFLDQPALLELNQDLFAEFRHLREERYRVDSLIENFVKNELLPQHLSETLHYHTLQGQKMNKPLWLTLTHFFNHQTHHRGQVTTLFHQIGVDFGVTDLTAMPLE
jgi:uncharacterized damage-inducible protein DinB